MTLYQELKHFFHQYLDKQDKQYLLISKLLAILSNITIIFVPLIQKQVLLQIQEGHLETQQLISLFLVTLIGTVALVIDAILLNHISRSTRAKLQRHLLMSSLRHKLEIMDQKGPGAFMVSIFGDTERASAYLKTNYFSISLKCLSTFIVFCIASTWSYLFPLIVIPTYGFILVILNGLNQFHLKEFKQAREFVFKLNPLVLEFLENKSSILSYADIATYENHLFSVMKERDYHFERSELCDILSTLTVEVIKTLSTVLFFCLAVHEIYRGRLSIASFIALTSYLAVIFTPITSVQSMVVSMNQYKMYKDRIAKNLKDIDRINLPSSSSLSLNHCTFAYQNEKILNDLSLTIDKKISLVGTSGEGKTTLINILLGEVLPNQGSCLLSNLEVCSISKFYLYHKIKLYPQIQELFDEELQFNICLNKERLSLKDYEAKKKEYTEIISGLKRKRNSSTSLDPIEKECLMLLFQQEDQALIEMVKDEMIEELAKMMVGRKYYIDEVYETLVQELELTHLKGRPFGQKGSKISGGEKNRVCLARFLLNPDIEYFILDEPFVHLDAISERKCLDVLKQRIKEAKGIIISHKLNIVQELSDEIVVLQGGEMTSRGTHDQLLTCNCLYQELYEKFLSVRDDLLMD